MLQLSSCTSAMYYMTKIAGEHILAGDDIYGGTSRLLGSVAPDLGIEVSNVDHTDLNAFKRAFVPKKTKLVILESPTNPRMRVCLQTLSGPATSIKSSPPWTTLTAVDIQCRSVTSRH